MIDCNHSLWHSFSPQHSFEKLWIVIRSNGSVCQNSKTVVHCGSSFSFKIIKYQILMRFHYCTGSCVSSGQLC